MTHGKKEDNSFTGTKVAALIESFRNDVSIIAERLNTVCEDVSVIKEDVFEIKNRLTSVEDVIRIVIPQINTRLTRLESKAAI